MHAGPKLTLACLNQRYWMVNDLLEVEKITTNVQLVSDNTVVAKQLKGS